MDARVSSLCFHCGEALAPAQALASPAQPGQQFCCVGCAAAAAWIGQASLSDYYRLRSAPGGRPEQHAQSFQAWDSDEILAEHSLLVDGGREITVLTDAMQCAACAWLVDRALRTEPGVLDAGANAITGRVMLRWDPRLTSLSTLMARMAALGYRPALATGSVQERTRRQERRTLLLRVGVAGLGAMQAMMFAEALYLDTRGEMAWATRDFFRWITALVSTPVVFYSGWPFIAGMLREWRGRRLGMDTLVAGSTLLAYFASLVETVRGGPQVWFDAAVMFVALLLLARMLEQRARQLASAHVDALARIRPAFATRETGDGNTEQIPLAQLAVGDAIRICPGDVVPADGLLLDLSSSFDQSLLTGESTPVACQPGDAILAGSVCRERAARVRVTRTGSDTRLSELARLVDRAQRERPRLARMADRVAGIFVAALLLATVAVFAWWHAHEPSRALEISLALLVVSCPCALSLAIPAALTAAHGNLAAHGVLGLSADALANLARVDTVIFDKTGTLTIGGPLLGSVQVFAGMESGRAMSLASALERDSRHPLAAAFPAGSADALLASEVREISGAGIEGWIEGSYWRIGQADFAAGRSDQAGVWLGDGTQAFACFELHEEARPDAGAAIEALRMLGLAVELSSGDAEASVQGMASRLGVTAWRARQTPEQKLQRLRNLQSEGRVVAMIGDGINDAPVLAGANVSLAIADGAALAQRAADIVVTSPSLLRIPQAIATARRTRRIIGQNLVWAVAYNLVALPLAATGRVTPLLAAAGMALSSLTVILNSLRLTRTAR